jgi:hypothetical protein
VSERERERGETEVPLACFSLLRDRDLNLVVSLISVSLSRRVSVV